MIFQSTTRATHRHVEACLRLGQRRRARLRGRLLRRALVCGDNNGQRKTEFGDHTGTFDWIRVDCDKNLKLGRERFGYVPEYIATLDYSLLRKPTKPLTPRPTSVPSACLGQPADLPARLQNGEVFHQRDAQVSNKSRRSSKARPARVP